MRWYTISHATVAIILSLSLVAPACKRRRDSTEEGTTPTTQSLPSLTLKDDTTDIMLTWVDKNGDFHVVQKPTDVPIEGRDTVRVVVSTKTEGTGDLLYIADLRNKNPDGTYPVVSMPRNEWEAIAEKRRKTTFAAVAPSSSQQAAPTPVPVEPVTSSAVIVYGASWCDACHKAMAYLKQKGIAAIEKDIEQDDLARREMNAKLKQAGLPPTGSIPILDVRGKILIGFDPGAVEQALRATSSGTAI